jgi:hypothetical protein
MGVGWALSASLELLLIRCAFGGYVVIFVTSNMFLASQGKKMTLMEFCTNAVFILLMSRLIRSSETIESAAERENWSLMAVIIATCVACFLLGIYVGRTSVNYTVKDVLAKSTSKDLLTTNGAVVPPGETKTEILQRKIKFRPRSSDVQREHSDDQTESKLKAAAVAGVHGADGLLGDTQKQGINYRPPFADDTYKGIIEKSRATVMSIVGLLSYPGCTNEYGQCQWTVIRSASSANLWVSKAKEDGILLRATSLVSTPAKSVMKWILHNDLAVGIESLCFRKETLKTFKGENSRLRRLSCKSGALTSSKRDFVLISSSTRLQDGTILLTSRSLQVPKDITANMRRPNKHGYIRGILHGSGFILRPIRCMDSGGYDMCEVFLAVHVDMLGSASGRVNESKREILADFVLQILDHLKSGAANYFNTVADDAETTESHDFFDDDVDEHDESQPQRPSSAGPVNGIKSKEDEEIEKNARALGLDVEQVAEIVNTSEKAVTHLKELYASKCASQSKAVKGLSAPLSPQEESGKVNDGKIILNDPQASSSASTGAWDTFYDNDGITVSEQSGSNRPVGTLNAFCTLEASPQTIRTLLVEHQDQIDGMLAGKSVLHKIDKHAYVQWLAYRSIWPLGARDFLLVTAEKPILSDNEANGNGFLVVSTSIDDICEEIDEAEFDDTNDGTGANALLSGADTKARKLAEFSRSKIRLAGYIGMPSATVEGGTDLSLFVDIDVYSYTPAWLVQILAQYGLAEMMGRIRRATMGQSTNAQSSQLSSVLARIQTWESRMKVFKDDEIPSCAHVASPNRNTHKKVADNQAVVSGRKDKAGPTSPTLLHDGDTTAPVDNKHLKTAVTNDSGGPDVSDLASRTGSNSSTDTGSSTAAPSTAEVATSAVQPVTPSPSAAMVPAPAAPVSQPRSPGQQLAEQSTLLMQKYLGMLPFAELELDWQTRVTKPNLTVDTSKVAGSTWQAIKGKTVMLAKKEAILQLLINDDRIGEFDDMFDFYKVRVAVLSPGDVHYFVCVTVSSSRRR